MAEQETTNVTTKKKKRISRDQANGSERKLEALLWVAVDKLPGSHGSCGIQADCAWPYLGAGRMFVQIEKFAETNGGRIVDISVIQ
jgi:hypothetical protein